MGEIVGTFLFTDLVDSTLLMSSLPPAEADELRRRHFALLRQAISTTEGTEVKSLGDGVMAMFSSPRHALACAVAIQQAVARHNHGGRYRLSTRVGVSVGDAYEEDGDFFGEPVVEASRLCAAAQGDEILATDVVRKLARRSGHSFANEREMELKGLDEPVVVWAVRWAPPPSDETHFPLPPRLPRPAAAGLVGRQSEWNQLSDVLKAVRTEPGVRVALVAGEAGVGKTALASSFARSAHAQGAVVLYGRCDAELTIPYQPFVEALGHFVSAADDAALAAINPDRLATLGRLLPELSRRRPDAAGGRATDPDAERWMLFGAVAGLLERASEEMPVVLVLDDLHWADVPTLQLLPHLAGHQTGHLLVVGTYRQTELSAAHPLTEALGALSRESAPKRISLSGLSFDDIVNFLEAVAGHAMDDDGLELAAALYRETDGNPFFVTEVLRHLVETRAIVQSDTGRWSTVRGLAGIGMPDSVRQVVASRVTRLGAEAAPVLAAAAVVGQEFDVDLMARIVGMEQDAILDVLDAAGSAALTAEVPGCAGRFRFAHALIQHTLYMDLGATRRARLHRQAAEALESLFGSSPGPHVRELARHWLAATEPARTDKAAAYARLAGEHALATLAPSEAVRWFQIALESLDGEDNLNERAECMVGLGEAQRQGGDPSYRATLLEAAHLARRARSTDALVQAALVNNRGLPSGAGIVDTERLAVLESALDALGPSDSANRARLLALKAMERTYDGDYEGRKQVADEALAMARRLADPVTELDVLLGRAHTLQSPDRPWDEQLAENGRAEKLGDQVGDPVGKFWAKIFGSWLAVQTADLGGARRRVEQASRLADDVGQPTLRWTARFSECWLALAEGDLVGAERLATDALEMGNDTGQPDTLPIFDSQLHSIRWHQGRLAELADTIAEIAAENPGIPTFRAGAAVSYAESDQLDKAQAMLDAEIAGDFAQDDFLAPVYYSFWAEVALAVSDRRVAELLYRRMAGWAELVVFSATTVHVAVAHLLGSLAALLGRPEQAAAHLEHALGIHERLGGPFYLARTRLELGRLLARNSPGEQERAQALLTGALDLARRYGFVRLEAKALVSADTLR